MQNIKIFLIFIIYRLVKSLPYAILISIMMSMGGHTQEMFSNLFISEEANFYDAVHNGVISISSANFKDWLHAVCCTTFIFPSILIALAINGARAKKTFMLVALLSFSALTAFDYILNDANFNVIICVVSNFIGGLVIAVIVILSLETQYFVNNYFEISNTQIKFLVSSFIAILYGITVVFIVYMMDKNIYTTTTSQIELSIKPPTNGHYEVNTTDAKNIDKNYGIFVSENSHINNLSFFGFSKSFFINTPKGNSKLDAEIRVLDGCKNDKNMLVKALSDKPTYIMRNLQTIKLAVDDGALEMRIIESPYDFGSVSLSNEHKNPFSINEISNDKYVIERMVGYKNKIKHTSWISGASYALVLHNFKTDLNNTHEIGSREITITTEQGVLKINLLPKQDLLKGLKYDFKTMPATNNNNYDIKNIGGIILTLNMSNTLESNHALDIDNNTSIGGFAGWVKSGEVAMKDICQYIREGNLTAINLTTNINRLSIDGKAHAQNTSSSFIYIANANLEGVKYADNLPRFVGESKVIYVDKRRMSLSRWEKIDINYRLAFFSLIFTIMSFIGIRLKNIFDKNKQYFI